MIKVCTDALSLVLKVWNKGASPDINYQFSVLQALSDQGISVSEPLGWGYNKHDDKVLLPSFDGTPVDRVDNRKLTELAALLNQIHHVTNSGVSFRKYDFIRYFFPDIEKSPDLHDILKHLFHMADVQQDHFIHGDFNMGNILEDNGKFTVIDWMNAQMGDPK